MDFASRSGEEGTVSRSWMNPDAVDESQRYHEADKRGKIPNQSARMNN